MNLVGTNNFMFMSFYVRTVFKESIRYSIFVLGFIDPYVRVLMLNGKTGKKMKKKKTKFLHAVAQPEFNETLTFDVAVNQLDTVQFLVVLCSKVSYRRNCYNSNNSTCWNLVIYPVVYNFILFSSTYVYKKSFIE